MNEKVICIHRRVLFLFFYIILHFQFCLFLEEDDDLRINMPLTQFVSFFSRARYFLEGREGGRLLTIYYFPPKWIFFFFYFVRVGLRCDAILSYLLLLHR